MEERSYFEPHDLKEALRLIGTHPRAAIVAGGTDLVVRARSGKNSLPTKIAAIHRVRELAQIERLPDGVLRLGALVKHAEVVQSSAVREDYAALADASALVGSPATRHTGSIGGNICNASPAMEIGSPLLLYDALVELRTVNKTRMIRYADFVLGPGKTALRPGELLAAILLGPAPAGGLGSAYMRLEYRHAMEIAIVGAAAMLLVDDQDICLDVRLALTAVAPTCVRATDAEARLSGRRLTVEALRVAAEEAVTAIKPIDDVRGSVEYRQAMVPVIARRALELAWVRTERKKREPLA